MRFIKGLFICVFWLLIIALMVTPLYLIYEISQDEMELYKTPEAPVLREVSIGDVVEARRADVAEYITVSGSFTSNTYFYQELNYRYPDQIRWLCGVGDEVQEGQVMGTYRGKDVVAGATGMIDQLNSYGDDAYVRFLLFTPVEFECQVEGQILALLKLYDGLTTADGETITLVFASSRKNADGTTDVRLSIESDRYTFGQTLQELQIMTGRVYQGTIVLPEDCVYQKTPGENEPWYVRQVTENGIFIAERQIRIGYKSGDLVCVSGIEEGTFYDSGYKVVAGG